jgi:hypothetical protein
MHHLLVELPVHPLRSKISRNLGIFNSSLMKKSMGVDLYGKLGKAETIKNPIKKTNNNTPLLRDAKNY